MLLHRPCVHVTTIDSLKQHASSPYLPILAMFKVTAADYLAAQPDPVAVFSRVEPGPARHRPTRHTGRQLLQAQAALCEVRDWVTPTRLGLLHMVVAEKMVVTG